MENKSNSNAQEPMNNNIDELKKRAEQGNADAQYQLGLCYEKGQGVKQSPKKAQEWYGKAAANGSSKAKQKIQ